MKTYLVGGAVRDRLLNLAVTEKDWVVVGATPELMRDCGFRQVGKDFPVFLHPDTQEEHALARTERKSAPGYRGFVVHASPDVTLEQDLERRDLTINAIAEDENGQLIDPFNGVQDLNARLLRHVSPAFCEDPVRILRTARFAARFASLGFRVADETLVLMRNMVSAGEADALVPERVWQETRRALETDSPRVYFEVLRACGALAVIFPELENLWGVPQPARWHPEIDTGVHTMMVLEQAARLSDDPVVRFAALVHDLGKAETPAELLPSHRGHEARSVRLVKEMCKRLRIPNNYRDLALLVAEYHGLCHRAGELKPATVVRLLENSGALRNAERFEQFLLACEADARGRTGLETAAYPQAALLRSALTAAAAVTSADVDQTRFSGRQIGERLHELRVNAVAGAMA